MHWVWRPFLVATAAVALPYLVVAAIFALGGASRTEAHAVSPDGKIEAWIARAGGSMQFPPRTLIVRETGSWFGPTHPKCVAARWIDRGVTARPARLEWRGSDTVLLEGRGVTVCRIRRCGIVLVASEKEHR